ncbi:DUF6998 domain-containing protein [Chloroflexota bacterium]
MNNKELLQLYSGLMEKLRERNIIRSSNNPVADYAEKVAVEYLGLTRAAKEAKGYDAIDSEEKRYQVKGRRITRHNKSRQLGVIRNLDEKLFDYVIAVLFNEDFTVSEIWEIPYRFIKENSRYHKQLNGHIFIADPNLLSQGKGILKIQ